MLVRADFRIEEFQAENDTEAENAALSRFGDASVAADQWDAVGWGDDGFPSARLLIWACAADAVDDPGRKSCAYVSRAGAP